MKKLLATGIAVLALFVGAALVYAQSDAKKDEKAAVSAQTLQKAPKVVQDTVKKLVGDGTMFEFAREKDGNFKLEYKVQGVAKSAEIAEDGKVFEAEETIDVSALPKPVTDAIKKLSPNGKITVAKTSTKDGRTVYELTITQSVMVAAYGYVEKAAPDAVKKLFLTGKIEVAETFVRDDQLVYLLKIAQSARVTADGKVEAEPTGAKAR